MLYMGGSICPDASGVALADQTQLVIVGRDGFGAGGREPQGPAGLFLYLLDAGAGMI